MEAVKQGECRFLGVGGEADVPDLSFLARLYERLEGPRRREDLLHFFHPCNSVELVEVEMIRSQPLERSLEFGPGALCITRHRLAGEKGLAPPRPERWSEFCLGFAVAVRGGDIEVVDPFVEHLSDNPVRLALLHSHHHDGAETYDGQFDIAGVTPSRYGLMLNRIHEAPGKNVCGRCCGERLFQEVSSDHHRPFQAGLRFSVKAFIPSF